MNSDIKISNPFRMTDWPIGKFLILIFSIQLAIFGLLGMDIVGIHIPVVREAAGFIYLTFVPGILMMRILKINRSDSIENLIYAAGLSISTLMLMGFLMNVIYPFLGIKEPISPEYLIITISSFVILLCFICLKTDNGVSVNSCIEIKDVFSYPALFLYLLPFFTIMGTYSVNYRGNNFLLMFMIVAIAVIVLLIGFDVFIPNKLYPFTIYIIAFSMLFHNALISQYIWGWDIHFEYFYSNLVLKNSIWDSSIYGNVNAMLSIVMLAPIYSNITGMNLTWVLKIVYPLIFSLLPLGLYRIFQKQTNDKIAFLSAFFCISFFTFFTEMLSLARQQIAELFLVLLIFLIIDKKMDKMKRSMLYILFAFSIIVSHYGISYIFLALLIFVWSLFYFFRRYLPDISGTNINIYSVLLYAAFIITWYMYVSSSSVLSTLVHIGGQISTSIYDDFINPATAEPINQAVTQVVAKSEGASIILKETYSPLHEMSKNIHFITQFFIIVGILTTILKNSKKYFEIEFIVLSLGSLMILIASVAIPFFASSLNTTRLYQISLLFLAPFGILGGIRFFNAIIRIFKRDLKEEFPGISVKLITIFFVIYFLFNTGFVYELTNDNPESLSLSKENIRNYANAAGKVKYYTSIIPDQDYYGALWLSKNRDRSAEVYNDVSRKNNLLLSYGNQAVYSMFSYKTKTISRNSYLYLGYLNNVENIMVGPRYNRYWNLTDISKYLEESDKIYTNNGSIIYIN